MAEGQGCSSNQGVKLLYIRDYLHKYTNKEHPKSASVAKSERRYCHAGSRKETLAKQRAFGIIKIRCGQKISVHICPHNE